MFTADFEVLETSCPAKILIRDKSTGEEEIAGRTITLFKTDLVPMTYQFQAGATEVLIDGLEQDYVLVGNYSITSAVPGSDSVYTKTHEFVTLGYTKKAKYDRILELEINQSIKDKKRFKNETIEINFHMDAAIAHVENTNLVDAQKSIDYIKEITGYSKANC